FRVRAGIVDRGFIHQCPQVRAGDAFGEMQLFGVRKRSRKPLLLVESDRIDDERLAVPPANRMAEERRAQILTRWMGASVHIDDAPRVRSGDIQQKDALQLRDVDDFKAGSIEESGAA